MESSAHLIACPHCAAMNRVPVERLAEAPQCGRCHEALFTGLPLALGDADFDRHALRGTLPLLVDFWAPAMRLAKVDTEASPGLGNRFGIRSIPTMVLLQGGREIARQSGAMQAEAIVRWVRGQGR
jgi:thioredoxin 2